MKGQQCLDAIVDLSSCVLIQTATLDALKFTNPDDRFWIKLDVTLK